MEVQRVAQAGAARREWAAMWPLPLVAMLGMTGSTLFGFSSGIFMESIVGSFGWSRAIFSSVFFFQMLLGLVAVPLTGAMTARFGPRRVAIFGMVPFALSIAALGTANGSLAQWMALCLLVAAFQAIIGPTVWITAIVGRFRASRGLAMAVTLAGMGLGSLIWPILAASLIGRLGWRATYLALGLGWMVVVLPLVLLFFFGPREIAQHPAAGSTGRGYAAALRSRSFVGLVVAGGLFACAYYGLIVHLVPILRSGGSTLRAASAIAGLTGVFSVLGRISTGYLLDRVPVRLVSVVVFLLPVGVVSALLLGGAGNPVAFSIIAVALLGVASGAELDIVTFIAARRFGEEVFASIYSIFIALLSLFASLGPLLGGALFDMEQSYTPFLLAIMPMAIACAAIMLWLPVEPPVAASPAG